MSKNNLQKETRTKTNPLLLQVCVLARPLPPSPPNTNVVNIIIIRPSHNCNHKTKRNEMQTKSMKRKENKTRNECIWPGLKLGRRIHFSCNWAGWPSSGVWLCPFAWVCLQTPSFNKNVVELLTYLAPQTTAVIVSFYICL